MANDRDRTNDVDQPGPDRDDMTDDRVRSRERDDVRSIADEDDEEFDDMEDLDDEDEGDGSV